MSSGETDTEESAQEGSTGRSRENQGSAVWTKENIQKLLAAMKTSFPQKYRNKGYKVGLNEMDWKEVAFPPFSPEACQKQWRKMLKKMRRVRSLTELIDEAEADVSKTVWSKKVNKFAEDGLPVKPPINGYSLFSKEQLKATSGFSRGSFKVCAERWRDLTDEERAKYNSQCKKLQMQYTEDLSKCLSSLDDKEKKRIIDKHGIKIQKVLENTQRIYKCPPGEPKLRSLSSNALFWKEQMQLLKEEYPDSRKRFSKIGQMWRELSINEKDRYAANTSHKKRRYSIELTTWFKTLTPEEQEDYWEHNPDKHEYLDVILQKVKSERTSDSEDEDLEESSSDEQENSCEEDEEEAKEEDEDITFNMY